MAADGTTKSLKDLYAPIEGSHWTVPQDFDVTFNWDYDDGRAAMMGLYRKGKEMQWDAETRIDWSPGAGRGQSRAAARRDRCRSPDGRCYQKMSDRRRPRCAATSRPGSICQFMQGEQGALICAAKIVTQVPDADSKFYAATQTIDEARHVESLQALLRSSASPIR